MYLSLCFSPILHVHRCVFFDATLPSFAHSWDAALGVSACLETCSYIRKNSSATCVSELGNQKWSGFYNSSRGIALSWTPLFSIRSSDINYMRTRGPISRNTTHHNQNSLHSFLHRQFMGSSSVVSLLQLLCLLLARSLRYSFCSLQLFGFVLSFVFLVLSWILFSLVFVCFLPAFMLPAFLSPAFSSPAFWFLYPSFVNKACLFVF